MGETWHLGMNLNSSDGHIMDFTIGWKDENDDGSNRTAFTKDYLSKNVWKMAVSNIAIVRHQKVSKAKISFSFLETNAKKVGISSYTSQNLPIFPPPTISGFASNKKESTTISWR